MVRAVFVYTLLLIGFLALVIFSNSPNTQKIRVHRRHGPGRRIVIRKPNSTAVHEQVAFDPVVGDLEWRREERTWETEYFQEQYKQWGENHTTTGQHEEQQNSDLHAQGYETQPTWNEEYGESDDDDYVNEDHFNISQRLELLFPQIDTKPKDSFISIEELQDWHVLQAELRTKQRTNREMQTRDKNHDGMISLQEYLPNFSPEELDSNSTEHGQPGWWKTHFHLADGDEDGLLNHTEFNDFLHPEESNNSKLHQWLRQEQITENDRDKDGKLNLTEFEHIYNMLSYFESNFDHNVDGIGSSEKRNEEFEKLDTNKDGLLTEDELEPVMGRLHPGEGYYAKQQAHYIMQQADVDKDERLTLSEMLEHPYAFYSTVYSNDEYPEYDHDEFR